MQYLSYEVDTFDISYGKIPLSYICPNQRLSLWNSVDDRKYITTTLWVISRRYIKVAQYQYDVKQTDDPDLH